MSSKAAKHPPAPETDIFEVRGYPVMLAAKVAEVFQVETREIVQNISRNNKGLTPLFPERYAFQLNKKELEALRSLGVIPKAGRGGSRALPWVITRKGAIRLATIMKVPTAMKAADVFVDVFDEVMLQVLQGQQQIEISHPSRISPGKEQSKQVGKLRSKISKAIDDLLNTIVDTDQQLTVQDELGDVAQEAVTHIKQWLRTKKAGNEKIEAETCLILEQARDMVERRQADLAEAALDRERKTLENFEKKIGIVERLLAMHEQMEPSAVVQLVGQYAQPALEMKRVSEDKA